MTKNQLHTAIQEAMWNKDEETLSRLAGCGCCCGDHTSTCCPARIVGNCRGQGSELQDPEYWRSHYSNLTDDEFYGR